MSTQKTLAICFVLLSAACAHSVDTQTAREAILATDRACQAAVAAKDIDRTVSCWTDDATVFPPGQPTVVGKEALRRFVSDSFEIPGFSVRWETTDVKVAPHGGLAYTIWTIEVTIPGQDGKLTTIRGKGVAIWRKEVDGSWKCVIEIWNPNPEGELAAG